MSSFSPVWRVDLRLRPSRIALALPVFLHSAAAVAVLQAGLAGWLQAVLLAAVAALLVHGLRRERRQHVLLREQATDWWLETEARSGHAELLSCRVWRYLVLMDLLCRDEQGEWRQRVVVFPDAVAPDVFRRLRVRLRHGALPAARKIF